MTRWLLILAVVLGVVVWVMYERGSTPKPPPTVDAEAGSPVEVEALSAESAEDESLDVAPEAPPASEERTSPVESDDPRSPHPYVEYTDATLRVMAYDDADAARLLGLRLRGKDNQESLQMTLRAAALSGTNEALIQYADTFVLPTRVNDQPVLANYRERYIIAVVADAVGPTTDHREEMEPHMWEAFINADEIMARLDRDAQQHIEQMRGVQRDVTGFVTIGGEPRR